MILRKYIPLCSVILCLLLWIGCQKTDKEQRNSVTFVINSNAEIPEEKTVHISGDFESWSGGKEDFKLDKIENKHILTLDESQNKIEFKFTLGDWNTVEKDGDGNDINNRSYTFSKPNDTIELTVENWESVSVKRELVLPDNLKILSDSVYMPQLERYRRVWVYTPPTYATSTKTYPVVYMHDAQNLFMDQTAYAGEWQVDEILDWLKDENGLELIVVGIDHGNEKRIDEMSAFKNDRVKNPEGNAYVDFIVETLKPKIDSEYRTKTDKRNTAVMGASLGGFISCYAGIKYPDIFGKVGVFSPSFWLMNDIYGFAANNAKYSDSKFYFLAGDNESEEMVSDMQKMESILANNGLDDKNLSSKVVEGGQHNEKLWKNEMAEAICWLFDKPKPKDRSQSAKLVQVNDVNLASGKIMRIDNMPSKYITPRPVDVWLPDNYNGNKTFRVLYMHDGQMLFDAKQTWNKQEWQVDEWMTKLSKENGIDDVIVVAIHNIAEERWQDLYPQKSFYYLSEEDQKDINDISGNRGFVLNGDNYLRFITKELKPYIDKNFSTLTDRKNTFVMGSSMGGLMSMYAYSEYPNVFSKAACLSTHWVGAQPKKDNPFPDAIFTYMEVNLPKSNDNKIYFDYGNLTLDAHYPQYAPRVDEILKLKGYSRSNSANTFFENTEHSENSWSERLNVPLMFLLVDD